MVQTFLNDPTTDDILGFSTHDEEPHIVIAQFGLIFVGLMFCCFVVQYYVGHVWKLSWLPEAAAVMLVGMSVGLCMNLAGAYTSDHAIYDVGELRYDTMFDHLNPFMLGFSSTFFFFFCLPVIIFNSGYHLKRKLFFANLGGIFSLAVVGTTLSTFFTAVCLFAISRGALGVPWLSSSVLSSFEFMEILAFSALISSTDPVSTLSVSPMTSYTE
jgi:Sodium/hydrogen exchanger family